MDSSSCYRANPPRHPPPHRPGRCTSPHLRVHHLNDRPDFMPVCPTVDHAAKRSLKADDQKKSMVSGQWPVDWPLACGLTAPPPCCGEDDLY